MQDSRSTPSRSSKLREFSRVLINDFRPAAISAAVESGVSWLAPDLMDVAPVGVFAILFTADMILRRLSPDPER